MNLVFLHKKVLAELCRGGFPGLCFSRKRKGRYSDARVCWITS